MLPADHGCRTDLRFARFCLELWLNRDRGRQVAKLGDASTWVALPRSPRILAPPKKDMPSKSSSSSGAPFLTESTCLRPATRAHGARSACRGGVREVWLFGLLARDNAVCPLTDVLVLTATEWRAPEGTALYREVVMHGIRFHLPS